MDSRQRIGFAVIAVVIAVVAVVSLRGGSDEPTKPARVPAAQASPSPAATATGQAELEPRSTPTATSTPTPTPMPTLQTIRVRGGKPVGGIERIEATKGERITFAVRADAPEEVHVHGYDLERALVAGKATRFSFDAEIDGIFEVELHGSGDQIAELRVEP